MPIPTRTSPVKHSSEPSITGRNVSQANLIATKSSIVLDGRRQVPSPSAISATIKSATSQPRTLPKAVVNNESSIVRHGRTPSTNVTSNRLAPTRVATGSLSRASSTSSSSVSHSTGTTSLTTNIRPRVATTSTATESTRSVSTGTARSTIGKSVVSQTARLKTNSTLQPRVQATRTAKDNLSTTIATRIKQPTGTVRVEPKVGLQQPSNGNTSISSSTSTATPATSAQNTSRLHEELYQLQLTHAQSSTTLNQYKQSVKTALHKKRTHLQIQQTDLLALESQIQEAQSTEALHEWLYPHQPRKHAQIQTGYNHTTTTTNTTSTVNNEQNTATQRIHNLSTQISTLETLHTSNALTPLTQFETWLETALSIREDRLSHTNPNVNTHSHHSNDLELITSLGHPWKAQMRSLQDRLQGVVSGLRDLQIQSSPSMSTTIKSERLGLGDNNNNKDEDTGIGMLLSRYKRLAETLLREVEVAVQVEKAVMAAEAEWEKRKVEEALADLGLTDWDSGGGGVRAVKGNGDGDQAGDGDVGRVYPGIWAV